jgi:hypothetical protein
MFAELGHRPGNHLPQNLALTARFRHAKCMMLFPPKSLAHARPTARNPPSDGPRHSALILATLLCALSACAADETPESEPPPNLDKVPEVAVPPADGPPLIVLEHRVIVRDRPSIKGKPLGTLRAGARVARAEEPYTTHGCAGGWYAIRPKGFVCAGEKATIDPEAAMAKVLSEGPNLERPLPYRYARVRKDAAVVYGTLPSVEQQQAAEPKLAKQRKQTEKRLGAAANDLPLDEVGIPSGPPVLSPEGEGVADDGYRNNLGFFDFGAAPAPLSAGNALLPAALGAAGTKVIKQKAGMAVAHSVTVGDRRFGVTPDGRFIPTDRLEPALGTTWHGVDVRKTGLPVAFALRAGVDLWQLEKRKASRTDVELERKEAILLTGRFRTVNRTRFYFTRDEQWIRAKDIILVPKRTKFPDWAIGEQKWLDVSLANQTLTVWVGKKPIYTTLISSGRDRLGDPQSGPATMQGVFRLRNKHVTRGVDDREVQQNYSLAEVPWVAEFEEGFAITGAYWLHRFGEAQSYHNIALSPADAHFVWQWSDPAVPEGWHSVNVLDDDAANTIVYIHK